eukprot:507709-Pelagomonas_calceolata.AAC.2
MHNVDRASLSIMITCNRQTGKEKELHTQGQVGTVSFKASTRRDLARSLDIGLVVVGSYDLGKRSVSLFHWYYGEYCTTESTYHKALRCTLEL